MQLFLKFGPGAGPAAQREALRLLDEEGAENVHRLFPDSTDPELKRHYVATIDSAAKLDALIRKLEAREEVEFAQGAARRSPKRGGR
jgi:hypothetical protein